MSSRTSIAAVAVNTRVPTWTPVVRIPTRFAPTITVVVRSQIGGQVGNAASPSPYAVAIVSTPGAFIGAGNGVASPTSPVSFPDLSGLIPVIGGALAAVLAAPGLREREETKRNRRPMKLGRKTVIVEDLDQHTTRQGHTIEEVRQYYHLTPQELPALPQSVLDKFVLEPLDIDPFVTALPNSHPVLTERQTLLELGKTISAWGMDQNWDRWSSFVQQKYFTNRIDGDGSALRPERMGAEQDAMRRIALNSEALLDEYKSVNTNTDTLSKTVDFTPPTSTSVANSIHAISARLSETPPYLVSKAVEQLGTMLHAIPMLESVLPLIGKPSSPEEEREANNFRFSILSDASVDDGGLFDYAARSETVSKVLQEMKDYQTRYDAAGVALPSDLTLFGIRHDWASNRITPEQRRIGDIAYNEEMFRRQQQQSKDLLNYILLTTLTIAAPWIGAVISGIEVGKAVSEELTKPEEKRDFTKAALIAGLGLIVHGTLGGGISKDLKSISSAIKSGESATNIVNALWKDSLTRGAIQSVFGKSITKAATKNILDSAVERVTAESIGDKTNLPYIEVKTSSRMVGQQVEQSCGPACALQLLKDQGIRSGIEPGETELMPLTESMVRQLSKMDYQKGTLSPDIADAMNELLGFKKYIGGSLEGEDAIIQQVLGQKGWIASVLTNKGTGHGVIVDNIIDDVVYVRDPGGVGAGSAFATGLEGTLSLSDFMEVWKGAGYGAVFTVTK